MFTSATTVNVAENSTGTVYTATATDANTDPVTYSLVPGGDSALFAITAAGAVSFVTPPDFETPRGNSGNAYKIAVQASDGKTTTQLGVTINVTNVDDSDYSIAFVNDWSAPFAQIAPSPVSANGVYLLSPTAPSPSDIESGVLFGDYVTRTFSQLNGVHGPNGALSVAASPNLATDRLMYALAVSNGELRLVKNITDGPPCYCYRGSNGGPDWDQVIMRIPVPAPAVAGNVTGWIGFGPDGYLYIAVGDGTVSGETTDSQGSPGSRLGKILRIDVSRDDFPADPDRNYGIPAGNPYVAGGGAPEVWALGLHRPSAVRFETTGELFFTDSGPSREEVNLLPVNMPNLNYGWPRFDGTVQRLAGSSAGLTPPVTEFARDSGPIQGSAILAGGVYTGPIASLANRYVFTNVGGERLWSVPRSSLVLGSTVPSSAYTPHSVAPLPVITRIGFSRAGDLYLTTPVGRGDRLFVVVPKP
ncbi:PQQ-dependent sugar dehydrogenase [Sphingomonas psychrotolerans]|uniref:PQQ-dependent sugar dehydrogenase n=1 Tax=Sphingomonas psychrotolerans TaxID=1327635 RepID=A0ABU3N040_9SPHN|nr:PQQ-dependent sugar dehydrogenase [Sphingomonas psychrotolerans]MDT8757852.1 PQQ-dependent sugar dehydrogenase [Sphingomonas psychrotolerans]